MTTVTTVTPHECPDFRERPVHIMRNTTKGKCKIATTPLRLISIFNRTSLLRAEEYQSFCEVFNCNCIQAKRDEQRGTAAGQHTIAVVLSEANFGNYLNQSSGYYPLLV